MAGFLYIRSIIRSIFFSRCVSKLDKRESATVIYLRRQHETNLFQCHFRCQMDDSLNILYSISVSVSISESTVNEGSCTGPDESHKTIVCVPGIDHSVKFRTWSADFKIIKLTVPVSF